MNNDLNTAKTAAIAAAVKTIKAAILQSRYQAACLANAEMLKLYFAIGGYVSANSRAGTWGTGAIDAIFRAIVEGTAGTARLFRDKHEEHALVLRGMDTSSKSSTGGWRNWPATGW